VDKRVYGNHRIQVDAKRRTALLYNTKGLSRIVFCDSLELCPPGPLHDQTNVSFRENRMTAMGVRRAKVALSCGYKSHPAKCSSRK
jgi:hypothetical protein